MRTTRGQVERLRRLLRPRHPELHAGRPLLITVEGRAACAEANRLARLAGARDMTETAVWNAHPELGPRICELARVMLEEVIKANPRPGDTP
jgi:hypothetical protein